MSFSVAIIGAGMTGLCTSQLLLAAGHRVQLFDKNRNNGTLPGGQPSKEDPTECNTAAFTARNPYFVRGSQRGLGGGWIEAWTPALESGENAALHVETEAQHIEALNFNAMALRRQLPIHANCHITGLFQRQQKWLLNDQDGNEHGPFDHVVLAMPQPQVTILLRSFLPPAPWRVLPCPNTQGPEARAG